MEHFQGSSTKNTRIFYCSDKKKRKIEPIDTLIGRGQQDSELHDQLNPTEIKITDDTFINWLKKYKRAMYKFTPVGLLYPATIQNKSTIRDV